MSVTITAPPADDVTEDTRTPARGAAFFDVDRTLLAGASGLHLAAPMRKRGLLTGRQLARTMLAQLAFATRGTDDAQLDRYTEATMDLIRGWDHDTVLDVVAKELETRVRPMVFDEALERIAQHQRQGVPVYAVSATMEEIVVPLAELLGLDGALGSQLEVVDGKFTGVMLRGCHGSDKAARLREFALAEGIDLAASVAYSDSITDEEFLRAVGRAYAVDGHPFSGPAAMISPPSTRPRRPASTGV